MEKRKLEKLKELLLSKTFEYVEMDSVNTKQGAILKDEIKTLTETIGVLKRELMHPELDAFYRYCRSKERDMELDITLYGSHDVTEEQRNKAKDFGFSYHISLFGIVAIKMIDFYAEHHTEKVN